MSLLLDYDMNDVAPSSGEYQMLPQGNYEFEITAAEQAMSSTAKPVIKCTLRVISDGDSFDQTTIQSYSLEPKAKPRLLNFFQALGLPASGQITEGDLIGRTFAAKVIHKTLPARLDSNGNPGDPKTIASVVGEVANGGAAVKPQTQQRAVQPQANANGQQQAARRVVGRAATPR